MAKNKVKKFKEFEGKLEITITPKDIVELKTLSELQDKKIEIENAKQITIDTHADRVSKLDDDIVNIQENIDQAILLGVT